MYTLGQAAKATGKAKSSISAAIKDGTISATKNQNGSYTERPGSAEQRQVASRGSSATQQAEESQNQSDWRGYETLILR
jgi:hypothetical protein